MGTAAPRLPHHAGLPPDVLPPALPSDGRTECRPQAVQSRLATRVRQPASVNPQRPRRAASGGFQQVRGEPERGAIQAAPPVVRRHHHEMESLWHIFQKQESSSGRYKCCSIRASRVKGSRRQDLVSSSKEREVPQPAADGEQVRSPAMPRHGCPFTSCCRLNVETPAVLSAARQDNADRRQVKPSGSNDGERAMPESDRMLCR